MEFEWDPDKRDANLKKHPIDFEGAKKIWDRRVIELQSHRSQFTEDRFLAIGLYKGLEITVIFTKRENKIRIISARRSRADERSLYWKDYG
jgi:uncharacterized DUF497 family protein